MGARTNFKNRRPKGLRGLNRTDLKVLRAAAQGMGASQTADYLSVTPLWVKKVRRRIRFDLGFKKGTPISVVVAYVRQHGVI